MYVCISVFPTVCVWTVTESFILFATFVGTQKVTFNCSPFLLPTY